MKINIDINDKKKKINVVKSEVVMTLAWSLDCT